MNNDPKKILMQILQNNSNPMVSNLIKMASEGDEKGIENFARNFCKERGKDFDQEFTQFMSKFKK